MEFTSLSIENIYTFIFLSSHWLLFYYIHKYLKKVFRVLEATYYTSGAEMTFSLRLWEYSLFIEISIVTWHFFSLFPDVFMAKSYTMNTLILYVYHYQYHFTKRFCLYCNKATVCCLFINFLTAVQCNSTHLWLNCSYCSNSTRITK